jgi:hypothetical protein
MGHHCNNFKNSCFKHKVSGIIIRLSQHLHATAMSLMSLYDFLRGYMWRFVMGEHLEGFHSSPGECHVVSA